MVNSRKRMCWLLGVVSLVLVLAVPGTAGATGTSGSPTNGQGDTSTSQTSSGGNAESADSGGCHLYASAVSFGAECLTGGSAGGHPLTIEQMLKGEPAPTCWDTPLTDTQEHNRYGYPNVDGTQWYVSTCLSGLNVKGYLFDQPALKIYTQRPVQLPKNLPACPLTKTMPYTPAELTGEDRHCIKTLQGGQITVTQFFATEGNQIPETAVAEYPTSLVRTHQYTAYKYVNQCSACVSLTKTDSQNAGGVTMYAEMTNAVRLYPYGVGGGHDFSCDGTAKVGYRSTPSKVPGACWWVYNRSSGDQPGRYYPMTVEATWTVYADPSPNGGCQHHCPFTTPDNPTGTFQKRDTIDLPVNDVQTLVIGQR